MSEQAKILDLGKILSSSTYFFLSDCVHKFITEIPNLKSHCAKIHCESETMKCIIVVK
jgi:hypothetical protein